MGDRNRLGDVICAHSMVPHYCTCLEAHPFVQSYCMFSSPAVYLKFLRESAVVAFIDIYCLGACQGGRRVQACVSLASSADAVRLHQRWDGVWGSGGPRSVSLAF